MGTKNGTYIQSLSTLQLAAIITVFIGHFWVKDPSFLNSGCVAFCFVYSGYFTAVHHQFPASYGYKDHLKFMWSKLAKLYPLHVLGIVLGLISSRVAWGGGATPSIILAHLTLTSSWIPFSEYFFGVNAVAWYICDLFFLYLMAPLLVRGLRKLSVLWQVLLIVALLVIQFTVEAMSLLGLYHYYFIYQFPVARLLDFAAGITIYNITQCGKWQQLKERITATSATVIEACSILLFLAMFYVGKNYLHTHCYRAFCAAAPAIAALFIPFILTSGCNGLISRLLGWKPFAALATVGAEIYLLQASPYFLIRTLFHRCGFMPPPVAYFIIQLSALLLVAWLVHRYYVTPIKKRMLAIYPSKRR